MRAQRSVDCGSAKYGAKPVAAVLDKCDKKRARRLRTCNIAAGILHAVSFVASIVVTLFVLDDSVQTQLTTDFRVFNATADGPPQAGPFAARLEVLGYYQLVWVLLPFPFITAAFHLAIAFVPALNARYTQWTLAEGRNPLRWLEYSLSASLMTWVICAIAGLTNVFQLAIVGVVLNVALQYTGYQMEVSNALAKRRNRAAVRWEPLIVGWLIFAAQWTLIWWYFFVTLASERPDTVPGPPWYVYTVVIGLFVQYAAFGFVHVGHFCGVTRRFRSAYLLEVGFITLSFTTKLFLTWNLLIGIATNRPSAL